MNINDQISEVLEEIKLKCGQIGDKENVKCLLKHLKEDMEGMSLTKMSLEEAYKFIDKNI